VLISLNGYSKINVDSLKTVLTSIDGVEKAKSLYKIGIGYYRINIDSSLYYFLESAEYSKQNNLIKNYSTALIAAGNVYYVTSNLVKAKEFYEESLDISSISNRASVYFNLALIEKDMGSPTKAITLIDSSIVLFKNCTGKDFFVAKSYNTKGNLFKNMGMYNSAIDQYMLAVNILDSLENKPFQGMCMSNISDLYLKLGDKKKAKLYKETAIQNLSYGVDSVDYNLAKLSYADSFLKGKDCVSTIKETIEYFERKKQLSNYIKANIVLSEYLSDTEALLLLKDLEGLNMPGKLQGDYYLRLANVLFSYKDYAKANLYTDKAVSIFIECKSVNDLVSAYLLKSELLKAKKVYDEALQYYSHYSMLKDSLLNVSTTNRVMDIAQRYEFEKQDKQIAILERDRALNLLNIRNKNIALYLGISGVFVLFIVFILYRRKQLMKIELANKNEILAKEEYNNLYQSHKIKSIKAAVSGQEEERQRISQELHDGVCSEITGVRMQLEAGLIDNDKAVAELNKIYDNTRRLSHDLVPPEFNDTSFEQLIKSMLEKSISEKQLDFVYEVDDSWLTEDFKFNSYRILQEAITNINKHSEATKIYFVFRAKGNTVELIVSDNGSANRKSYEGNGIKNMKSRAEIIGGSLDIDNNDNGTVLTMTAPLSDK